ncbi:MAG: hypothetical protein WC346_09995 [Methanogenium sp.]|jgi:cell fate (sporulation/competence/biofilm development) regulator YlbF (YheA/YmcA/DUF963 family)
MNMPNDEKINVSTETVGSTTSPEAGAGQGGTPEYNTLLQQYQELEKKLGEQGNELGEYKKFTDNAYPILEKLGFTGDDSDAFISAINDGKITNESLKAIIDGKVTTTEATQITQVAKQEAKQESKNTNMTQEEIDALVTSKVSEALKQMDTKVTDLQDELNFEKEVNEFIEKTEDLKDYIGEIDKWLDDHNSTDLRTAYYAVKGELGEKEAKKKAEEDATEEAKKLASNASGGRGSSNGRIEIPKDAFHEFVAPSSSANF